jgi:hypothetical protein
MNLVRTLVGLGAVLAVAVGLFAVSLDSAHAQGPFTAYGIGQSPGSTVTASIDGATCGSASVDSQGNWLLAIDQGASCNPVEGDTINFALDGASVSETATWTGGGSPATSGYDPNIGITLTVGSTSGGGGTPAPSDTGNAGLAYAGGATSAGLWLALLALAGLTVAGSRVATRSR